MTITVKHTPSGKTIEVDLHPNYGVQSYDDFQSHVNDTFLEEHGIEDAFDDELEYEYDEDVIGCVANSTDCKPLFDAIEAAENHGNDLFENHWEPFQRYMYNHHGKTDYDNFVESYRGEYNSIRDFVQEWLEEDHELMQAVENKGLQVSHFDYDHIWDSTLLHSYTAVRVRGNVSDCIPAEKVEKVYIFEDI